MMTILFARFQNQRNQNQDAFTLIEALVATVIVAILAAISFPVVLGNGTAAGHDNAVRATLPQYEVAMAQYRVEYDLTAKPSIHAPVFKKVHHAKGSHFAVVSNGGAGYCVLGYSDSGEHNSPASALVITESDQSGSASCPLISDISDASTLDWN